jgi:CheY-like chemotaxis protein
MTKIKRVLVVDDEIEFMNLLKLALELDGGYEVQEVYSALRAVEVAHEFNPDVIVLDCMMPELSGHELASLIRRDPLLKAIPIIFLTATVSEPEVRPGEDGEMQPYLPKPLRLPQLIKCIEDETAAARVKAT